MFTLTNIIDRYHSFQVELPGIRMKNTISKDRTPEKEHGGDKQEIYRKNEECLYFNIVEIAK